MKVWVVNFLFGPGENKKATECFAVVMDYNPLSNSLIPGFASVNNPLGTVRLEVSFATSAQATLVSRILASWWKVGGIVKGVTL